MGLLRKSFVGAAAIAVVAATTPALPQEDTIKVGELAR